MVIDTVKDLRELLEKLPDDARVDFSLGCNKSEDPRDEEFELSYLYQIIALLYYGFGNIELFRATLQLFLDDNEYERNVLTFQLLAPQLEDRKDLDKIMEEFFIKNKDLINS